MTVEIANDDVKISSKHRQNIVKILSVLSKYQHYIVKLSLIDNILTCCRKSIVIILSVDNNPRANDNRECK